MMAEIDLEYFQRRIAWRNALRAARSKRIVAALMKKGCRRVNARIYDANPYRPFRSYEVEIDGVRDSIAWAWKDDIDRAVYRKKWITRRNRVDGILRWVGFDGRRTCAMANRFMKKTGWRDPSLADHSVTP